MTNHAETLRAIGLLLESIQFLRGTTHTRMYGLSNQFILDVRRELQGLHQDLGLLVNRQIRDATGDPRPLIEDVRRMQ